MKTITVRELIEQLQEEDQDAQVIFSADYGDRCNTQQALPIRGMCEVVAIERSSYSSSGYAIADTDEAANDDDVFVVIR